MTRPIPPSLSLLALDSSADERAIRRAYATRLKAIDTITDPAAFQQLRSAYEAALAWAASKTPDDAASAEESAARSRSQRLLENASPIDAAERPAANASKPAVLRAGTDPQIHARQALDQLTQRIGAEHVGDDEAAMAFAATAEELRTSTPEALHAFEQALIDALMEGRLASHGAALFEAACAAFRWLDTPPSASRHPREQWLEAVLIERARWAREPPATRQRVEALFDQVRQQPLSGPLLQRWRDLRLVVPRYPRWFAVQPGTALLDAWRRHYETRPFTERQERQRAAAQAKVRSRQLRNERLLRGDSPFSLPLAGAFAALVLACLIAAIGPSCQPTYQAPRIIPQSFTDAPANARTCPDIYAYLHQKDWMSIPDPAGKRLLAKQVRLCLNRGDWPRDARIPDLQLKHLGLQ